MKIASQEEEKKGDEATEFKTAVDSQESFYTCDDCYKELRGIDERQAQAKKKLILAMIPFGIPGSGKSTFLKSLMNIVKALKWTLVSISSD